MKVFSYTTTMSLRPLKPEDESIVKDWLESYLQQHLAWWQVAFEVEAAYSLAALIEKDWQGLIKPFNDAHAFVQVFEDERGLLGIVEAQIQKDFAFDINVGVLAWIYVAEHARGQGIADGLLQAALDWMKEQKAQGKMVNVTAQNEAAVKLYQKQGFKLIDYRMLGKL